jgi:lipid-A-disaccharide synthase
VASAVQAAAAAWPVRPIVVTELADKHDAFAAAAAALTKSGTSTLELALAGVPMVVAYRVNAATAAIAKRLVKVRYASILNLIAERAVIPELIQKDCTPRKLADALAPLLLDAEAAAAQRAAFGPLLAALRAPEGLPSAAAAQTVLGLLDQT